MRGELRIQMITFSQAIGIFFAGIFSGYAGGAKCPRAVTSNRNQARLQFGKAVQSDEASGGVPLNYFLHMRFFQAARN